MAQKHARCSYCLKIHPGKDCDGNVLRGLVAREDESVRAVAKEVVKGKGLTRLEEEIQVERLVSDSRRRECEWCKGEVTSSGRGRPSRFCCKDCRDAFGADSRCPNPVKSRKS